MVFRVLPSEDCSGASVHSSYSASPPNAANRVYKTSSIVSNVCDSSARSSLTLHGTLSTIWLVCARTCIHAFLRHSGGRTSELTTEMIKFCQGTIGLETCMHLTCTNMQPEKIDIALTVRPYNILSSFGQ